ncbi:hypothetical protein [uncultured Shewanella sp.]|uniref:hypothetical protein n=1 Tax=uncultured Shewanella sp. TaxID=173975 RepID=UPI0026182919|nr:hypothetical protein [uncultured Shewanella sp.]
MKRLTSSLVALAMMPMIMSVNVFAKDIVVGAEPVSLTQADFVAQGQNYIANLTVIGHSNIPLAFDISANVNGQGTETVTQIDSQVCMRWDLETIGEYYDESTMTCEEYRILDEPLITSHFQFEASLLASCDDEVIDWQFAHDNAYINGTMSDLNRDLSLAMNTKPLAIKACKNLQVKIGAEALDHINDVQAQISIVEVADAQGNGN